MSNVYGYIYLQQVISIVIMIVCVVGAGISGAVVARKYAELGNIVHVFEKRNPVSYTHLTLPTILRV